MSTQAPARAPRSSPRTGGCVRNEDAHEEVLRAAVELLEEVGYGKLTIEGVAIRAQVAKSTIYRWWKSKGELVMEAFGQIVAERVPAPDTGSLRGDLTVFIRELYRIGGYPSRREALRGLMAESLLDPAFAEHFHQWVADRRAIVALIISRAAERGEVAPGLDPDYAVDLVFGPFWYRLLVGHAPLDAKLARQHAARLLAGIAAPANTDTRDTDASAPDPADPADRT